VHSAAIGIPWARPPRFRANVDVSIAVHVTDLQFVAAELRVENDVFERILAESLEKGKLSA
jgi:hypothetical protein